MCCGALVHSGDAITVGADLDRRCKGDQFVVRDTSASIRPIHAACLGVDDSTALVAPGNFYCAINGFRLLETAFV